MFGASKIPQRIFHHDFSRDGDYFWRFITLFNAHWLTIMDEMTLAINPLFGALTRPAMVAGVTFEYHMLNLIVSMCAFIGLSPLYGLAFIPLHAFGWAVCRYDTHFFTLCVKRFLNLPQIPNMSMWRSRAYEPF